MIEEIEELQSNMKESGFLDWDVECEGIKTDYNRWSERISGVSSDFLRWD